MKAGPGLSNISAGDIFHNVFRTVFCDAFHKALYGEKIQWLIVGMYEVITICLFTKVHSLGPQA